MATAPKRRTKVGDPPAEPTEDAVAVALPPPAVEEAERAKVVLPGPVRLRWEGLAEEASRKRLRVEIRIKEGTFPEETAEGDLRGAFLVFATNRGGVARKLGETELFGEAIDQLARWVEGKPGLGADELREELKAHGRRLVALGARDVVRKKGSLSPVYLDFRDRILPLAWDNLVDAVKVEALEDFVRKVADQAEAENPELLAALAAEARGLVPSKEETDATAPD